MKKILCFFIAMLMVFALALSVFADTELKGNAKYDCSISEDGKTAKVVVTLSDYYTANSIMIVPEFDSDELTLKRGRWLVEGVLAVNWNAEYGDAVIAFANATDVNTAVFEMTFTVIGDAVALDDVSCDIIVKTVDNKQDVEYETPETETTSPKDEETKDSETTPPKGEYVDPYIPIPSNPPTSNPVVTSPVTTQATETESMITETVLPETDPIVIEPVVSETEPEVTEPSDSEEETTDVQETETDVIEPKESETEETKPSASTPNYGGYITQSDYEKNRSNNNLAPILIVAGIAVVGACVAVVLITRKKSK